jgi:hypothetical protein
MLEHRGWTFVGEVSNFNCWANDSVALRLLRITVLCVKDGNAGATNGFWAPHAFQLVAAGGQEAHTDLHVGCTGGAFQGFVTIDYTVP